MFLDGHVSHLTYNLSKFCSENGIELIALYPNATHILQPLDVSVFGPLKKAWASAVHAWRMANSGDPLNKYQFAPLLSDTIKNNVLKDNIKNGFRVCGMYPWNPDAVDYSKCITTRHINNLPMTNHFSESTSDYNQARTILESLIEVEKIVQFKNVYDKGEEWNGPIECKDLYYVWKKTIDTHTCEEK